MRVRPVARLVLVLPLLFTARHTAAQGLSAPTTEVPDAASSKRAQAERLFHEGRELMDQGELDTACPKFAESYRLDAALGTLLNLAVCHESQGLLATAWTEYDQAVPLAQVKGDTRRLEFAEAGKRRLDGRFARVRLALRPELRQLKDVRIELDGRALSQQELDEPRPLERGSHVLRVSAPGHHPWSASLTVSADTRDFEQVLPSLEPLAQLAPTMAPPSPAPTAVRLPPRPELSPVPQREPSPSSSLATWGLVLGGAGIVGAGVGSAFGLVALSEKNERDDLCSAGVCRSARGVDAHRAADRSATIANVAFVAGGVLLAGGVALYLLAPNSHDPSSLTPRATRLGIAATASSAALAWEGSW